MEVDKISYLPSSRQIQRLFGGLPNLRKALGYTEVDFSKGENRSKIGLKSHALSKLSEQNLQDHLREYFHEVFVHIERPVRGSKVRLDFYVYNRTENFGVDIFTTENMHTLRSNLFIKLRKYSDFKELLFLVVDSPSIKQVDIESYNLGKTGELLPNAKLITLDSFLIKMKEFPPYENPIK